MMISDPAERRKKLGKMTEAPEFRRFSLTPDGNVCVEGNRIIVYTNYAVLSPLGVYWDLGEGCAHRPSAIDNMLEIAYFTEHKGMVLDNDSAQYFSRKQCPEDGAKFLLLLIGEVSELYYVEGSFAPVNLRLKKDAAQKLLPLAAVLASKLDNAELSNALKAASALWKEASSNEKDA